MTATSVKFLITKSMTTRAIQTQCDPQHQAEYQESEHRSSKVLGGAPARLSHW